MLQWAIAVLNNRRSFLLGAVCTAAAALVLRHMDDPCIQVEYSTSSCFAFGKQAITGHAPTLLDHQVLAICSHWHAPWHDYGKAFGVGYCGADVMLPGLQNLQ